MLADALQLLLLLSGVSWQLIPEGTVKEPRIGVSADPCNECGLKDSEAGLGLLGSAGVLPRASVESVSFLTKGGSLAASISCGLNLLGCGGTALACLALAGLLAPGLFVGLLGRAAFTVVPDDDEAPLLEALLVGLAAVDSLSGLVGSVLLAGIVGSMLLVALEGSAALLIVFGSSPFLPDTPAAALVTGLEGIGFLAGLVGTGFLIGLGGAAAFLVGLEAFDLPKGGVAGWVLWGLLLGEAGIFLVVPLPQAGLSFI